MAERRIEILDAATSIIARHGIRGLRVEEVAAEAGVAISLLYYYFRSRLGLVQATLEYANEQTLARLHEPRDEPLNGRATVEMLLLGDFDDATTIRRAAVVWNEVTAAAIFEPELFDRVAQATERWLLVVSDAIRQGTEDGTIPAHVDADGAAARLTAVVEGLTPRWLGGIWSVERCRRTLREALAVELDEALAAATRCQRG